MSSQLIEPPQTTGEAAPSTREAAPSGEVRRATGSVHPADLVTLVAAAVGALALSWIVCAVIAPWSGPLGFVTLGYVAFLGLYAALVAMDGDRQLVVDRLMAAAVYGVAGVLLTALVVVVVYSLWQGRTALSHANFYTEDMSLAGPLEPLTVGGVLHAALGTLVMMAISLSITIPLGLVCALFLSETRGPFTRFVRAVVEAMTALPSVVAGLFVYAGIITLQSLAGRGEMSGLAASIALSVMMLPIVIRAADVVLRLVPGNLKEAAAALGSPAWRIGWRVVLPTARSGLMTAIILGAARGVGETSPVLLTAGYTTGFNVDPLDGPMVSLPLLTFTLTKSSEPNYIARGFGSASVLMLLVLVLFALARVLGGRQAGDLSSWGRRRRAAASRADARRFAARDTAAQRGGPVTPGRGRGIPKPALSRSTAQPPPDQPTPDQPAPDQPGVSQP